MIGFHVEKKVSNQGEEINIDKIDLGSLTGSHVITLHRSIFSYGRDRRDHEELFVGVYCEEEKVLPFGMG